MSATILGKEQAAVKMKTIQDFEKELEKERIAEALEWFNSLRLGPITEKDIFLTQIGDPFIRWEGYIIRFGYVSDNYNSFKGYISKTCLNCNHFGDVNNRVNISTAVEIKTKLNKIKNIKNECCKPKIEIENSGWWRNMFMRKKKADYPIPHSGENNE